MDTREFSLLKTFACMTEAIGLKKGDKFLTGTHMIDQLEQKTEGQSISYYEVLRFDGTGMNFEYATRYDFLEKAPEEDRRNKL